MTRHSLNWAAIIATLSLLFPPASDASRARELVLGTGDAGILLNGGSLIQDFEYNVFYNPAYVNNFRDWGIVEKSNFPGVTAQGGFITSLFTFSLGAFFNRENEWLTNRGSAGGAVQPYAIAPERPIELFFGADMGIKWGLALGYASKFARAGTSSDVTLNLGAIIESFEPFLSWKISGTEPNVDHRFFRAGTRYRWGEWSNYLLITSMKDRPSGTSELTETAWGAGLTRSARIAEGTKLHFGVGYIGVSDSGGNVSGKRHLIPFDLSFEGEASSWFSLMAGLSYHIADRTNLGDGSFSTGDTTTGRIGATVHLAKLDFDWAFGKVDVINNGRAVETGTALDSQNFDLAHGFFTAASLKYRW